jgi:hypothetical protein
MIRTTQNETIKSTIKTTLVSLVETTFGSPDGIVPDATNELDEATWIAESVTSATWSIIPSNGHNGLLENPESP